MDLLSKLSTLIKEYPLHRNEERKLLDMGYKSLLNEYILTYSNTGNPDFDNEEFEKVMKTIRQHEFEKLNPGTKRKL
jgi:hypothetical protein